MNHNEIKWDVLCIGQVTQDVIFADIPRDPFCDTSVVYAEDVSMTVGGDAANESVILSRLGNQSAILVRLGTGRTIYQELQDEGVDLTPAIQTDGVTNQVSFVFVRPDGNHDFLIARGQNDSLKKTDFQTELFMQTRALSAASLFSLGELDGEGIAEIFRIARSNDIMTFADTNNDYADIGPHGCDSAFPYIDYLLPSLDEAVYMSGERNPVRAADYFLSKGVGHVAIKLGQDGCFYRDHEEQFFLSAYSVKAVDTTGCGDNFSAGFIHAVLEGRSACEALSFASAAGALNAMKLGAHAAVRSAYQVESFMKDHRCIRRNSLA